jgi:hypothetical protein
MRLFEGSVWQSRQSALASFGAALVAASPGATQTSKVASKIRPDNPNRPEQQRKFMTGKMAGIEKTGSPDIALCWSFFDRQKIRSTKVRFVFHAKKFCRNPLRPAIVAIGAGTVVVAAGMSPKAGVFPTAIAPDNTGSVVR